MGRLSLESMLSASLDRRAVMEWHLTSNCFPPVSPTLVPAALRAVSHVSAGRPDQRVKLPRDYPWKARLVAAARLVEALHLEAFVTDPDAE